MSARAMRRVLSLSVAVVLVVGAVPFSAAATQPVPVPVPESGPASVEQHGDVIVRFGPSVSASSVAASAHERAGAESVRTLDQVPGLQSVTLESGITVEEAIAAYEAMPGVLYAEPNDIDIQFVAVPNDTRFSDQWHLDNTGQTGGTPDADMDVPEAWSFTTGSGGVVVAVLDNGVDYEHPDLADNMWRNPGEIPGNDVDDDANGWVDDIYGVDTGRGRSDPAPGYSDGPHGTRCASIVGAQGGNALGISGVSQNVSIMALKTTDVFGDPDVESMVEAIEYADDMGAHIISCSWGAWTESQAITDAIAASDSLFVFAAGNEGEDVDAYPMACGRCWSVHPVGACDR